MFQHCGYRKFGDRRFAALGCNLQCSLTILMLILIIIPTILYLKPVSSTNEFSNFGDGSFAYIWSAFIPIFSFIHIGVFSMVSAGTLHNSKKSLSYSMVKIGCLYICIHSIAQFIISIPYTFYYYHIPLIINFILIMTSMFSLCNVKRFRTKYLKLRWAASRFELGNDLKVMKLFS